jgi:hypothetical protein
VSLAMTKQEREHVSGRPSRRNHQYSCRRARTAHRADLVFVRTGRRAASRNRQDFAESSAPPHAGRFSVCVQTETPPYKYVSVEGPVVAIEPADLERDRRPLAHRYLGVQRGDRYIENTRGEPSHAGNVLVRMLPERWLTVDYAKA